MNGKKVKAIRRVMRAELKKGADERWIAHPSFYVNTRGEKMLKFKFQYFLVGGKNMVQIAKRIYKATGVLPRSPRVENTEHK